MVPASTWLWWRLAGGGVMADSIMVGWVGKRRMGNTRGNHKKVKRSASLLFSLILLTTAPGL